MALKNRLVFFLLLLCQMLFGQNIGTLEKEYQYLKNMTVAKQAQLDSLEVRLNYHAEKIDREKRKEDPDIKKVKKMMANGLSLGEKVDSVQKELKTLQTALENKKMQLASRYSTLIDSLQVAPALEIGETQSARQQQIVAYTEKYLLFSPAFNALNFDPKKVREIDPANETDTLAKRIAIGYLQSALADVDAHLAQIKENRREIETTVRLDEKTREFLDEIDDDYFGLGPSQSAATALESGVSADQFGLTSHENDNTRGGGLTSSLNDPIKEDIYNEFTSIYVFFKQLDIVLDKPLEKSAYGNYSLENYLTLLEEAEKRLQQYSKLIAKKLKE